MRKIKILMLLFCIGFIACQNKTKTSVQDTEPVDLIEAPVANDTSNNKHLVNLADAKKNKYQFELIEHSDAYDTLVYKYWENLSEEERAKVLESEDVPEEVIKLYNGQFILSDDDATFELLDELTSEQSDAGLKALYFHLFNRINLSADGALSEGILEYVLNVFLSDIPYALEYFTKNNELMEEFAEDLGVVFYYQQGWTCPYTLDRLKEKIKTDLNGSDKYDKLLSRFYEIIERMLKGMN